MYVSKHWAAFQQRIISFDVTFTGEPDENFIASILKCTPEFLEYGVNIETRSKTNASFQPTSFGLNFYSTSRNDAEHSVRSYISRYYCEA